MATCSLGNKAVIGEEAILTTRSLVYYIDATLLQTDIILFSKLPCILSMES